MSAIAMHERLQYAARPSGWRSAVATLRTPCIAVVILGLDYIGMRSVCGDAPSGLLDVAGCVQDGPTAANILHLGESHAPGTGRLEDDLGLALQTLRDQGAKFRRSQAAS